jgi:S1-C subfamily serine protease
VHRKLRWLALVLPLLPACNRETIPAVAESPAPTTPPVVPASAALRPTYDLKDQQAAAGTGFLVTDQAGKVYFLTAAHIMDDETEWRSVRNLSLATMAGERIGSAKPSALRWVGKPFNERDATTDFAIWEPTCDTPPVPLTLAAEDPKKNEWVWVTGLEVAQRGPQKFFRAKVTGAEQGGVTLRQEDRFQLRGFSGDPVLNTQGQVVGTVLAGPERPSSAPRSAASANACRKPESKCPEHNSKPGLVPGLRVRACILCRATSRIH